MPLWSGRTPWYPPSARQALSDLGTRQNIATMEATFGPRPVLHDLGTRHYHATQRAAFGDGQVFWPDIARERPGPIGLLASESATFGQRPFSNGRRARH